MWPQVAHFGVDERPRGLREQHLPPVADRCDASALVHIQTDIALLRQPRFTRVQAHTHPDGAICEGPLTVLSCTDCIGCTTEGDEERVSLSIDLDAVVRGEGSTEASAMLVQGISITLAEPLQQTSGALHVREKQGDDTCGQITHRGKNHLPVGAACLPG